MKRLFHRSKWALSAISLVAAAGLLWTYALGGADGGEDEKASASPLTEESGTLNRPYTDWRQQEIPFGTSSFDLAPWRSYMDTWDANRYLDTLGVVFNVYGREADATAQLLSEAGFRSARVEIGWGNVDYNNISKLREPQAQNFREILRALRKHGIRPIILLNANAGNPVPSDLVEVKLKKAAPKGSREIYVAQTSGIVPHYTGLSGQAYQTMFPVITGVDARTGRLTLSAPLNSDLKTGLLKLTKLKYRPISGTVDAAGKSNSASQDTLNGWKSYLQTVTRFLKETLGTTASRTDAGFDLEVWNEMTFGSQFLDINNYYNPKLILSKPPSYTLGSRTVQGPEVLLPLTVQYVRDATSSLPGVRVISGFSNQRPWENGLELYPGQTGFSRHYYTGYNGIQSMVTLNAQTIGRKYMSATGVTTPGRSSYIPRHVQALPEYWFYAYQTEFVVRDLQPFPGPFTGHFRYANPKNGHQAEVWMTETNWWRWPFTQELMKTTGTRETDPRLRSLMQEIGAKATTRTFTFYSHKGVETVNMYAVKAGDLNYGLLSEAFFKEIEKNGGKLTDTARKLAGSQIQALLRIGKIMKTGEKIDNPRPLEVTKLTERSPRVVLQGNRTDEHPDTFMRDDLAILPFQLGANKFAVGYYIVTRDLTQDWQPSKDMLDPNRYAMPPQKFAVTLANVAGERAAVYAYDPLKDARLPVNVLAKTANTITVEVESTDYPRFLMMEENSSKTGPVLSDTKLNVGNAGATFTFRSNAAGTATVSWGAYPARSGGSFTLDYYVDAKAVQPVRTQQAPLIATERAPSLTKGAWKWSGTIMPEFSETYSFLVDTNLCKVMLKIDGQTVINGCTDKLKSGDIELFAGQEYKLELTLVSDYPNPQQVGLYWASKSQPKELVPPFARGAQTSVIRTEPGKTYTVPLSGFKPGDGVKADFVAAADKLTTRFPMWNYDVRGVWWEKSF